MRLILRYDSSDGCTYSCTTTFPVEYESAEALLLDFLEAAKQAILGDNYEFTFLGETFDPSQVYSRFDPAQYPRLTGVTLEHGKRLYLECPPEVMTLDEYFASALQA